MENIENGRSPFLSRPGKEGDVKATSQKEKERGKSPRRRSSRVLGLLDDISLAEEELRRSSSKKRRSSSKNKSTPQAEGDKTDSFIQLDSLVGAENSPIVELSAFSSARKEGKNNQNGVSVAKSASNRRETFAGGAEEVEKILLDSQYSEDDSLMSQGNKTKNPRRETCDAADMDALLQSLEDNNTSKLDQSDSYMSNSIFNESISKGDEKEKDKSISSKDMAESPKNDNESASESQLFSPRKSKRLSKSDKKSAVSENRRETFDGGALELNAMLDDGEQDGFASEPNRRETCDASDMMKMLQNMSDSSNTSGISTVSSIDPKYRDIIRHEEVNLTGISNSVDESQNLDETVSPAPKELPLRRSPRLNRSQASAKKSPKIEISSHREGKSTPSSQTANKQSGIRRETFDGGSAAFEQLLADVDNESTSDKQAFKNERRLTADASDIQSIMNELEKEESKQKNLLGKRVNTPNEGASKENQSISCSPCPNSRDSVDTVVLMNSVAALLDQVEADESSSRIPSTRRTSTASARSASLSSAPSPLLNFSTAEDPVKEQEQHHHWKDLSMDDYTLNKSLQSEDASNLQGESNISDDGTVNTVDLLDSVRHLVKNSQEEGSGDSESNEACTTSHSSYQELSIHSDISDDTSFLSRDERRDSFDDNTISTLGSLKEFFQSGINSAQISPVSTGSDKSASNKKSNATDQHELVGSTGAGDCHSPQNAVPLVHGLKSCLSSRKKGKSDSVSILSTGLKKKGVVFGSPSAAEFNKTSPVTNFTPMQTQKAKSLYSMEGKEAPQEAEDDVTNENSRILEEWDRLTNASADGSVSDEEEQEGNNSSAVTTPSPVRSSKKRRKSLSSSVPISHNSRSLKKRKRRKSRVHISDDEMSGVENNDDFSMSSMISNEQSSMTENDMDVSRTEDLPENLEELMQQNDLVASPSSVSSSCSAESSAPTALNTLVRSKALNASMSMASQNESTVDKTQTLEADLNALMSRVESGKGIDMSESRQMQADYSHDSDISASEGAASVRSSHSSADGGLEDLLVNRSHEESLEDTNSYDVPARIRQMATCNMTSSPSSQQLSPEIESVDDEISLKRRRRSSISNSLRDDSDFQSDPAEHTQELETNLESMMEAVNQVANPETQLEKSLDGDDTNTNKSLSSSIATEDDDDSRCSDNHRSGSQVDSDVASPQFASNNLEEYDSEKSWDSADQSESAVDSSASTLPDEINSFSGLEMSGVNYDMTTSTSLNAETPQMLRKLRGLNAVSRRQSLTHAAHTPMASAGKMSIGMKRLSMASQQLESTTKRLTQRYEANLVSATSEEVVLESVLETATNYSIGSQSSSKSRHEQLEDDDLERFMESLKSLELKEESDSLHHILQALFTSYEVKEDIAPLTTTPTQQQFVDEISSVFAEVLTAATSETIDSADKAEVEVGEEWSCLEKSTRDALLVQGKRDDDLDEQMRSSLDSAHVNWKAWEFDLMQVALDALTSKKLSLREENQELEASIEDSRDTEEDSIEDLQNQLKSLQKQLEEVTDEVDSNQSRLNSLQEETTQLVEQEKQYLVSLTSMMESSGSTSSAQTTEPNDADQEALEEKERQLQLVREEVEELELRMNIINKLTYCRITKYQSDGITARVQLSKDLFVDVVFSLARNSDSSTRRKQSKSITLVDIQVLPSFEVDPQRLSQWKDSESALVACYYSDFMTSEERKGPLSRKFLSSIAAVSDIPGCLQRISGYVSALRDAIAWLGHVHLSPELPGVNAAKENASKWIWGVVAETSNKQCSIFLQHSSLGKRVDIPLSSLIAGDMEVVPSQFDSSQEALAPLSPSSQKEIMGVHQKLEQLADRCASPFGSFPVGQIMHAIAPN